MGTQNKGDVDYDWLPEGTLSEYFLFVVSLPGRRALVCVSTKIFITPKTLLRPVKINSMFYLNIFRKSYARARKNNTDLRKIHKLYSMFPVSILCEITF